MTAADPPDPPDPTHTLAPPDVVNVAAYQFVPPGTSLTGPLGQPLPALKQDLHQRCLSLGLLGTILLAPEGVNLFLAGPSDSVDALLSHLRTLPGLHPLPAKYSRSAKAPFNKLRVKLKKEIIPFGRPETRPATYTSPRLTPHELKQWIDEGKPVVLLDTRNAFEVAHGTFRGAVTFPMTDFRTFPAYLARLDPSAQEQLKAAPVVTFCTGGIRCEKAAPYLESQGFGHVYQLEGGILNYFEKVGSDHYDGACYVFDQRVALTPNLQPVDAPPPASATSTPMTSPAVF